MFDRKKEKKLALASLKKHWVVFMFLCLIGSAIGSSNVSSYTLFTNQIHTLTQTEEVEEEKVNSRWQWDSAITAVLQNAADTKDITSALIQGEQDRPTEQYGNISVGHTEGVFAALANQLASGAFIISMVAALMTVLHSAKASLAVLIILAFMLGFVFWMFIINLYRAAMARCMLEGRVYEKVPMRHMLYFGYIRKWASAAWTLLVESIYLNAWWLTIVGGFIKRQSYFCVPYIVAENPSLKANEAITLSRKMMDGHKMECFKLKLSFIGWNILDIVTFGISGMLFSNPYFECTMANYYASIRKQSKENGLGTQLFDTYLYEAADQNVLLETYGEPMKPNMPEDSHGLKKVFGICSYDDPKEARRRDLAEYNSEKSITDGKEYPYRLVPFEVKERRRSMEFMNYDRRYCVLSLILLFAVFSMIGWVWEVSLHLVQYGNFVNRGVMHGPWLPIYGTGGLLVLLILNPVRDQPVKEFFGAIVLCGFVEYMTAWGLSAMHNGEEWWSYNGYFLNVDGRICAEGLLVFGIGAMLIVYFAAPLLDNLLRRLSKKTLRILCAIFLVLFLSDWFYSNLHPNTGEGVTSFVESEVMRNV